MRGTRLSAGGRKHQLKGWSGSCRQTSLSSDRTKKWCHVIRWRKVYKKELEEEDDGGGEYLVCWTGGWGWEVTHTPTTTPSCFGWSPCAGLRALGMNGARAVLCLWSQPGMRGLLFFLLSLSLSLSVVQAAGSTSSYLQQWNIPSAALIVHRRAGRHLLANQGLPLGSLGSSWWGGAGTC